MHRLRLYSLLLCLALLFAQLGALTHGVTHIVAGQDQSAPDDKLCDLCASYAQLGGTLISPSIHFDPVTHHDTQRFILLIAAHFIPFTAFAARAPPR